MQISQKLSWWLANFNTSFDTTDHPPIDFTLTSDASFKGWGAAAMGNDSTGAQWTPEELEDIHILELSCPFCFEILQKVYNFWKTCQDYD